MIKNNQLKVSLRWQVADVILHIVQRSEVLLRPRRGR